MGRPEVTGVMVAMVTEGRFGLGDETGNDGFEGLPTGDVILGDVICNEKWNIKSYTRSSCSAASFKK